MRHQLRRQRIECLPRVAEVGAAIAEMREQREAVPAALQCGQPLSIVHDSRHVFLQLLLLSHDFSSCGRLSYDEGLTTPVEDS